VPKQQHSYWYQIGFEEGYEEGRRLATIWIFESRFGVLSERSKRKLRKLASDDILRLAGDSLNFGRKSDLTKWLKNNS
jgi:hypothetical protein